MCTVLGYRGVGRVGVWGYEENAELWLKQRVRLINSEHKLRTTKVRGKNPKNKQQN